VIVGGLTLPTARTVNVAGTRAFVGGGFAFVGGDFVFVADDELASEDVVDVVRAPPPALVPPPAALVEVTDAEDVVAAEAVAGVEACVEPPHDTGIRANAITTKRRAGRLTFPG
jgi:hypothetical protein